MADLRDLKVRILGDASSYKSAMDDVDSSSKKGEVSVGRLSGAVALGSLAANGLQMAYQAAKTAIGGFIGSAADVQQTEQSFEVLLGSADKARSLLSQVSTMAAKTPFEFPELASTAQNLLAYGTAQEDILPTLQRLGDLSAGNKEKFQSLALVFGQVKSAGRLMGQDLLQITSTGIPILDALAKEFGVTKGEVRDMVSAGKIDFNQFNTALSSLADPGGQFFGLMDKQSQTLSGRISTMKDNFNQFGRSLLGVSNDGSVKAGGLFDILSKGFQKIIDFTSTEKFTEWTRNISAHLIAFIKVLLDLATMYMTHKRLINDVAQVLLSVALAIGLITTAIKIATVAQELFNLVMETNPIVLAITLIIAAILLLAFHWNEVTSFIVGAWQKTWDFIKDHFELILTLMFGPLGFFVSQVIKYWSQIKDGFTDALDGIKHVLSAAAGFISEPFRWEFNQIAKFWNATIGKLDFTAPSWIPGFGGKGWKMPQLPQFASGTQNFDGGWMIAGEHGAEALWAPPGSKVKTATETQAMQSKAQNQSPQVTNNYTYNITAEANVGMYAGMPIEKRAIAEELWRELVRSAKAQGVILPSIGSVVIQ